MLAAGATPTLVSLAATALLMVAAVPAVADDRTPAGQQERVAFGSLVADAIVLDEPAVIVALMDRAVAFELDGARCGAAYRRPGRATGKAREALAACLVKLVGDGTSKRVFSSEEREVALWLHGEEIVLGLVRVKGKLRIAAIDHGEIQLGEPDGELVPDDGIEVGPPLPLPPAPVAWPILAPAAFEALRLAGDKDFVPDDATRSEMVRSGRDRVQVALSVCLDATGAVRPPRLVKASGFAAYDRKVVDQIQRTWRFRPHVVDGQPSAACSPVVFTYVPKR